jgi:Domain of unknown function (DUF3883)
VEAPTDHQLLAAVRVGRVIDEGGNTHEEARQTFPLVVSQGEHRTNDLLSGEGILAAVGLICVEPDGRIAPTPMLAVLTNLPDADAVRYLRHMFAQRSEAPDRVEVGLAGEAVVVDECRADLISLGRADLVSAVHRVSALDDSLGYDVAAPMIAGPTRWLEVKTSRHASSAIFEFFLTRNEYEIGRCEPAVWALVACTSDPNTNRAKVLGWCRAQALQPYLPEDRNGRWTEALVRLPRSVLFDGIPRAV